MLAPLVFLLARAAKGSPRRWRSPIDPPRSHPVDRPDLRCAERAAWSAPTTRGAPVVAAQGGRRAGLPPRRRRHRRMRPATPLVDGARTIANSIASSDAALAASPGPRRRPAHASCEARAGLKGARRRPASDHRRVRGLSCGSKGLTTLIGGGQAIAGARILRHSRSTPPRSTPPGKSTSSAATPARSRAPRRRRRAPMRPSTALRSASSKPRSPRTMSRFDKLQQRLVLSRRNVGIETRNARTGAGGARPAARPPMSMWNS